MWEYRHNGDYPDYLCHFGIKGMKWGVRRYQNADGTLTNAGKRRYSKAWKDNYMNSSASENPAATFTKSGLSGDRFENIRKSMNDNDGIKSAAKEMEECAKEAQKLLGEYGTDRDVQNKYKAIAGISNVLFYGPTYGYGDTNMKNISDYMDWYTYDDGDQAELNSASIYINTKGLRDKGVDIVRRDMAASKRYEQECAKKVSDILGAYGDQKLGNTKWSPTINESIAWRMKNYDEIRIDDMTNYSSYTLREACDWPKETKEANKAVKQAEKIVNKINLSNNNLRYMNQALENLGYENADMNDMTESQWGRLNREMVRLNPNAK